MASEASRQSLRCFAGDARRLRRGPAGRTHGLRHSLARLGAGAAGLFAICLFGAPPASAEAVRVCTSLGAFTIELAGEDAPLHVENFLRLVDSGFYNGTLIHRVIEDRLVQGGAYDREFVRRAPGDPVVNESRNGLTNRRGTVGAARLRDPDSASSQFYVNLADAPELDATSRRPGYTVFGRVTSGLEVLEEIGAMRTGAVGPLSDEVPIPPVVVESIARLTPAARVGGEPADAEPAPAGSAAGTLARIDAQRAECAATPLSLLIDEAAAAIEADRLTRARYALDNFFASVAPTDPDIARAQNLFRRLPREAQSGIAPLVAHCPRAVAPTMPDGRSASLADMEQAQADVRGFITSSEAYLECLSEVIDSGALDDFQEVAAVSEHNEIVAQMERTAEEFNRQLREFRDRD